ncbi:MAG: ribonuclease H-like domain-containing protein [Anaerolineaceae bacterium]|nr:ribonuclease H-like domain-containing protein [Anaerolineaceae bacterium]
MESFSDKLKSLGVHIGADHLRPVSKPPKSEFSIGEVLQGEEQLTPLGSAFVVKNDYPMGYSHGLCKLCDTPDLKLMAQWGKTIRLPEINPQKILFLDTETSGLAGGTGTFAFLIGLGFQTDDGFRLVQLFLREPGQEPALLAVLARIIAPFEAVVTFNGKSFDIPLLKTRHILNGIPSPFSEIEHLDMLPLARRIWRNRLPSRALGDLETAILEVARAQEEVPGWLVPQIYFDYLHTGDARPLAGVFYHNSMDILSLAGLFNYVADLLNNPLNNDIDSLDMIAIARLYEELGYFEAAVNYYEHSLSQGMPEPFFVQTLQRFAMLYRRQGEWDAAVRLWEKAVEHQQISACIELAKYYEHQKKDNTEAIRWTKIGLDLVEKNRRLPDRLGLLQDLERRLIRLNKKQT